MKPPAMHETLTRVISQAHVQPILRPAGKSVVYIHPVYQPFLTEERPTRVRPEIVVAPRAGDGGRKFKPRVCQDCREEYVPVASNQIRCAECRKVAKVETDRKAGEARKQRIADRLARPLTQREIEAATRKRARIGWERRRAAPQQRKAS